MSNINCIEPVKWTKKTGSIAINNSNTSNIFVCVCVCVIFIIKHGEDVESGISSFEFDVLSKKPHEEHLFEDFEPAI